MNKYLLLRDNKQSGPYTVPEIIAIGIKAYDLVWLEGKSAAWRYPSEIEELKAYSPAVEEQPFDRFYKKPQPVKIVAQTHTVVKVEENSRFEPKPLEEVYTGVSEPEVNPKKVYINFPGAAAEKESPAVEMPPQIINKEIKKQSVPLYPDRTINSSFTEDISSPKSFPEASHTIPVIKKSNNKLFYAAVAACLFLGLISGFLFVSYNRQRESVRNLNAIVQQLEAKQKSQVQTVPAALVNNSVPQEQIVDPPLSATVPENENLSYDQSQQQKPAPVKRTPATPKNESAGNASGVVFNETKPIEKTETPKKESVADNATSHDNLFKLVNVKPNDFKTGLLGGISNLKFEITNNSLQELQRVAIEIKYLGPEKKVVKTQTIYFENIAPGSQSTIEVPRSNRGVTIQYAITDIKS
jgi:hypothetical protein